LQMDFVKLGLFQMSIAGGVIILLVTAIRALFLNRLPKKTFLLLWIIALLRLALPFSAVSPFSVYGLLPDQYVEQTAFDSNLEITAITDQKGSTKTDFEAVEETGRASENKSFLTGHIWQFLWLAGVIWWGGYFICAYVKCRREFRASYPVNERTVSEWQTVHLTKRKISVRQTGCISAPLSYGVFHPVILMPVNTDWNDKEKLFFVLEHELVHIKRFDAVTKLIVICILCVHWFNPAVWVFYVLFNQDLELSCDEEVVRYFGEDAKGSYARALISMEEKKSGLMPLCNSFSKNAAEQRIKAVMKIRKASFLAVAAAGVLIAAVFICFATSARGKESGNYLKAALNSFYSEEEGEMLAAVLLDHYETMTVSEYQQKLWTMTDDPEYMELLDEFAYNDWALELSESKEDQALWNFIQYFNEVLEPLTAEDWQTRQFNGFSRVGLQGTYGTLEYVVTLTILKPEELTCGEYRTARLNTEGRLHRFVHERSQEELADEPQMTEQAEKEIAKIISEEGSDMLDISIQFSYTALDYAVDEQIRAQWEETVKPYLALGLTWKEEQPYEFKMYFQGREVKGIYDEKTNQWISWHTGNSTYADDAVELYAVYENDVLTGLRQATEEEQAEWTYLREFSSVQEIAE